MTEIAIRQAAPASLPDMVRYAEHLANANLLPGQYRKQPANVLFAMEYGRTLGITPIAAITGIHVIEGKPSASAALISGLVRQAGHKLRVRGNDKEAWAQIIRADDPTFEGYQVTWTLERAKQAGLAKKDVWQKYPAAMLKARAITEVARDACEEVLFGLHYTPEELGSNVSEDGLPVDATVQQLHRVQPGETDQWTTPTPQSTAPEQWIQDAVRISEAAEKATDPEAIRDLYREANSLNLLAATVLVKLGGEEKSMELGAFLVARGEEVAVEPSAGGGSSEAPTAGDDEGVVDATIVDSPEDDYAAAVADLRAAAETARLDVNTFEADAAQALGMALAEAPVDAIRALAATIRTAA